MSGCALAALAALAARSAMFDSYGLIQRITKSTWTSFSEVPEFECQAGSLLAPTTV